MASGDTKTNQYLDVAANGTRADLPSDTCCETRSQTLIREVAERIMDVEDEVERLENNPDVVDIVDTYEDLEDYDTGTLTDKDIIRVLNDETHDGESTYYRYDKQSDTFTYIGSTGSSGGSEIKTYHYPSDFSSLSATQSRWVEKWRDLVGEDVFYVINDSNSLNTLVGTTGYSGPSVSKDAKILVFFAGGFHCMTASRGLTSNYSSGVFVWNDSGSSSGYLLAGEGIADNLTTSSSSSVLSAKQGKILNEKIPSTMLTSEFNTLWEEA